MSTAARAAVAGALFLALFSGLYTAGATLGAWPPAPEGGFAGSDLAAGFAFGLVLLVTLLVPRPPAPRAVILSEASRPPEADPRQ